VAYGELAITHRETWIAHELEKEKRNRKLGREKREHHCSYDFFSEEQCSVEKYRSTYPRISGCETQKLEHVRVSEAPQVKVFVEEGRKKYTVAALHLGCQREWEYHFAGVWV